MSVKNRIEILTPLTPEGKPQTASRMLSEKPPQKPPQKLSQKLPWIIAHRGARREAPENTRIAFELALHYPIDGIEFDVQMTADGVPVICHDPTLHRIFGQRRRVANCTHAALSGLDWGGWYDSRFSGEPLPTLAQTLKWLGGRTRLFIEIKADAYERRSGRAYALSRTVASMLSDSSYRLPEASVYVLSFDPEVLRIIHQQAPQCPCVLNVSKKDSAQLASMPPQTLERLWAVDVNIGGLSTAVVAWAHKQGLKVFTYTCNTARQMAKAIAANVDGIISDRPAWLSGQLIKSRYTHGESGNVSATH